MSEDKRQNEIIRIQKKRNNFVMMDKGFLNDDRLSYKAKGLLAYILSKPDNWKVIIKDLINHSSDGKKSVYSGLRELKECGYYKKVPVRDEKGQRISYWESVIFECPEESADAPESNPSPPGSESLLSPKGEVDESKEKSASALLTPFVYIDKVKERNVNIQKGEHNNNNSSKKDMNKNDETSMSMSTSVSVSKTDRTDMTDTTSKTKHTADETGADPANKIISADKAKADSFETKNKGSEPKTSLMDESIDAKIKKGLFNVTLPSAARDLKSPQEPDYYTAYLNYIQARIDYNNLIHTRPKDADLIDELVFCMMDVILTERETVKIAGEEKNRDLVKRQYLMLNGLDIELVLDKYKEQRQRIKHVNAYLKAMLYNVGLESEHYYVNAVRADGVV